MGKPRRGGAADPHNVSGKNCPAFGGHLSLISTITPIYFPNDANALRNLSSTSVRSRGSPCTARCASTIE